MNLLLCVINGGIVLALLGAVSLVAFYGARSCWTTPDDALPCGMGDE